MTSHRLGWHLRGHHKNQCNFLISWSEIIQSIYTLEHVLTILWPKTNEIIDSHETKIDAFNFWLLRGHFEAKMWPSKLFWNPKPISKNWHIKILTSQISDPWEFITQNWYYFWNLWPYKPVCRYQWRKKLNFEILTSLSLLRSDKWLLGDHNPKPMLFSKSLTQKSLSRDTHEEKSETLKFDLSEVI